jgi:hypothetical protein
MTLDDVLATAKDAGFEGVILEMIAHTYKLGTENERKACAKVCDKHQYVYPYRDLGTLIRARGKHD